MFFFISLCGAEKNAPKAKINAFFLLCSVWHSQPLCISEQQINITMVKPLTHPTNRNCVSSWESLANDMMMDGAMPPSPVKRLYETNFSTTSFILQL